MPLKNTEAITLRTYPYREADRIVVFFTRDYGKVRGIARAARRLKSHFGSALEPMSHVRLLYFEKENQDLVSVNSCDLLHSHAVHRSTLEGTYYCAYLAELLGEVAQEGEVNDKLFRLLLAVLDPELSLEWQMRARYFETWLLRLEGIFPPLGECGRCGRGLAESTVYLGSRGQEAACEACAAAGDLNLGSEEVRLVSEVFSRKVGLVSWNRWRGEALKNLGRLNSKLIQCHLEKPLKSGRFLKEIDPC